MKLSAAGSQSCNSGEDPQTPLLAREAKRRRHTELLDMPDEILDLLLESVPEPATLSAAASTCHRLRTLVEATPVWRQLWTEAYGDISDVTELACRLAAGSWKRLYGARTQAERASQPWSRPSAFEVEAAVRHMVGLPPPFKAAAEVQDLCLVFLVDGSGSVTQEDFDCMTSFMQVAVELVSRAESDGLLRASIGVVQFSNDLRVELAPAPTTPEAFSEAMGRIRRMNGGTNIALAVQKAGQLMKAVEGSPQRVVALLTDGRIDSLQAREAYDIAARLADEQSVSLHAFGVGRGVDKQELVHIISACGPDSAESRYTGLCVLDEAPW